MLVGGVEAVEVGGPPRAFAGRAEGLLAKPADLAQRERDCLGAGAVHLEGPLSTRHADAGRAATSRADGRVEDLGREGRAGPGQSDRAAPGPPPAPGVRQAGRCVRQGLEPAGRETASPTRTLTREPRWRRSSRGSIAVASHECTRAASAHPGARARLEVNGHNRRGGPPRQARALPRATARRRAHRPGSVGPPRRRGRRRAVRRRRPSAGRIATPRRAARAAPRTRRAGSSTRASREFSSASRCRGPARRGERGGAGRGRAIRPSLRSGD